MSQHLRTLLVRFRRDRRGIAATEFAILAPVLLMLLLGSVTLFILFRNNAAAENATFVVADIVSRQTTVSNASLAIDRSLFVAMLADENVTVGLRITSIKKASGTYTVDWTYAVAPLVGMTNATIPIADLPLLSDGDSVLVVDSSVSFTPLFSYPGFSSGTHINMAINQPRFTSSVVKSD